MKNTILILISLLFITGCMEEKVVTSLQDRGGVKYDINAETPYTEGMPITDEELDLTDEELARNDEALAAARMEIARIDAMIEETFPSDALPNVYQPQYFYRTPVTVLSGIEGLSQPAKWYKSAAEQGDANAQYNLGVRYGTGQGVLKDYVIAHMYFNIASVSGNKSAIKNRGILEKWMTSSQLAEAQKLAREWMSEH